MYKKTTNKQQWWIGITGGVDFTKSNLTTNTVLESTSGNEQGSFQKGERLLGEHYGLVLTFDFFAGLNVSFQPQIQKYQFQNKNVFTWTGTESGLSYSYKQTMDSKLNYFEFPLFLKYDISQHNFMPWKRSKQVIVPFVEVGCIYGYFRDAYQHVGLEVENTSISSTDSYSLEISDQFIKSHWQVVFGGGVSVDVQSFRFAVSCNYSIGLNKISANEALYSNQQLTTDYYNVMSDLKLKDLAFSFQVLFPLKFIYSPEFKKS